MRLSRAALLVLALLCGGCATAPFARCPQEQQLNELIYFGTESPDGVVSADAWSAFLRDVVTPRFPQGLTTWQASGQWRSADGTLTREESHVLNLIHPDDAANDSAVQAIVSEYKTRFRQEAVLRVASPACVSY